MPQGESIDDVLERLMVFRARAKKHVGQTIAAVTHEVDQGFDERFTGSRPDK